MTKLDLTISASTLDCVDYDELTAKILGIPFPPSEGTINIASILADYHELYLLQEACDKLQKHSHKGQQHSTFQTLNLVFSAPNASTEAPSSDRRPLKGVFSSPMTAFHTSDPWQLSCFTHLQLVRLKENEKGASAVLKLSALEYSREHRSKLLQQEFGSWLLEEHIEKAVIATTTDGTIVFWNRFASTLYQYDKQYAIGKEIRTLISTRLFKEKDDEMMRRLGEGEHFSTMYKAGRADGTEFMAHCTTTPIMDANGQVQFMVGVSADYSQLHDVMSELEKLNANLEKEVVARTEQLLAREKHLRMIGAAMKESDTGVMITNDDYKITWCNEAVSRMLGLKKEVILGMKPWDLPLQQETKGSAPGGGGDGNNSVGSNDSHSNFQVMEADEKASSLETYFMEEKSFNEKENDANIARRQERTGSASDNEVTAMLNNVNAPVNSSNSDSASHLNVEFSSVDGTSAASLDETRPVGPTRPTMAAVCFKLDSPMPLHIMVGVQAMPPDDTITVQPRSEASKSTSHTPSQMQILSDSQLICDRKSASQESAVSWKPEEPQIASPAITRKKPSSRDGTSMRFMITLRDITAERKAEEAQLIAERASAANEAKTQMMQMLSHELRTPLQGIMGVASTSMMDIEESEGIADVSSNCSSNSSASGKDSHGIKGPMYDSLSTILASSRLLLTLINNTLDTRKINADMMQKIELGNVSMMSCIRDSFQYCGPFAIINEAILELCGGTDGSNVGLTQILNTTNSQSNLMSDVLKKKHNVVGNRLRLEQVIVNLLSNGIKYTTPGTAVIASVRNSSLAGVLDEIKAAPSSSLKFLSEDDIKELDEQALESNSDVIIFSVRDHGKGIPPGEYGKVFGEFQQLDASAEKDRKYEGGKVNAGQSSGSGLGLNLAMKFVNMMNGHIWFQNTTDGQGGATFSFYLERSKQLRDIQRSSSLMESSSGGTSKMNETGRADSFNSRIDDLGLHEKMSRFRVLVIDDSMINLKVLARMMNKIKVEHCETALSGAAALEYLEPIRNDASKVPNLILCDLQMPGMDGYELMGHLREMNICSSPIIMACSADWGSETEGKCLDVGFDGLLRKPITVTYLKEFLGKTQLPTD